MTDDVVLGGVGFVVRVARLWLVCLVVFSVLAGGVGFDAAPVSAASCSVGGSPGATADWFSRGDDSVADRVFSEFGVSLPVLDGAYRWSVPVCVGPGGIDLTGPVSQVLSPDAGLFEAVAVEEAAAALMVSAFRPEPLLSPDRGSPQFTGLETWLAVDPSGWVSVGPVTGSDGGVTVTASAAPVGVVWSFGDGTVVECDNPGELYVPGGPVDAPCGKDWDHSSAVTAHAVQAAVRYEVSWSSSLGNSGSLSRVAGSLGAYGLEVREIQAVRVWGDRDRLEPVGLLNPPLPVVPECSLIAYSLGECGPDLDAIDGSDDGECGALSGPIRAAIAAGGDQSQAVVDGVGQWADDNLSGVAETAGGFLGFVASGTSAVAGWTFDHSVGYVVDAGGWVYEQGSEFIADHQSEIRWVQGKAGEVWGVVGDEVIAVAGGVIDDAGVVLNTAVAAADSVASFAGRELGRLQDQATGLRDAIAATGIGDQLGVGIEIITGVANGVADVAVAVGGCIVWIGQQTYNALPDALKNLPILGALSIENIIGCSKAIGGNITDLWSTAESMFDAAADPGAAFAEFKTTATGLIDVVMEDPGGVAQQMGIDVLNDLAYTELRDEHGYGQWAGAIACEVALIVLTTIFTGGALTAAAKAGKFGRIAQKVVNTIDALIPDWVTRQRRLDPDGDGKIDLDTNNADIRNIFSCNSFPAGTLVLLRDNIYRPIELITPDQQVLGFDTATNQWETGTVTNAWAAVHTDPLTTITIADDSGFTATTDHPVWNQTTRQWTPTKYLNPGEEVLTPNGPQQIKTISTVPSPGIVYDLTVTKNHNFTVTNQPNAPPTLVHNCDVKEIFDDNGDVIGLQGFDTDGSLIARLDLDGTLTEFNPDGTWTKLLPDGTKQTDALTAFTNLRELRTNNPLDNSYGPAESLADAIKSDGTTAVTESTYNYFLSKNRIRPDISDLESATTLKDTVTRLNSIADRDTGLPSWTQEGRSDYLDALGDLFEADGTPLDPRVRAAIDDYIDKVGPPGGLGGVYPGTHAEIQAINNLLNQGFDPTDIRVATLRLKNNTDFLACAHCTGILDRVGIPVENIVTGVVDS